MPVVMISKLSHARGGEVAETAASKLGYDCIDKEVFEDASRKSGIPAEKIRKALTDGPSLLGMSLATRNRCVAHAQAALCGRLLEDNVVYHGPFGHLLVRGVPHVLNVRVQAPKENRAALLAEKEGSDSRKAQKAVSKDDKQRLSIAEQVFGADDDDQGLFNLVIDTSEMEAEEAAELVAKEAKEDRYKPMTYSIQCMRDLELSSRVRAALVELDPHVVVQADKGAVRVRTRTSGRPKKGRLDEIRRKAEEQDGVKEVDVETVTDLADLIARRSR